MKILILMGSPRLNGNTAELCKSFIDELENNNAEVKYVELEKMKEAMEGAREYARRIINV